MTNFQFTEPELMLGFLRAGAWLVIGAAIGAFHFLTLRWNVRNFEFGRSILLAFAIQLVRFALVAAVLGVIAKQFGALPLLIAAGGILAVRPAIMRLGAQS